MNYIKRGLRKISTIISNATGNNPELSKQDDELFFWADTINDYIKWYEGGIENLYGEKVPTESEKVKTQNLKDSAILTWLNIHQKTKYLEDLKLTSDAFKGEKILDIGSGPLPSAIAFTDCEIYCLDPLLADYTKVGFPLHYYDRVKFINGPSENIPVADGFFDGIISVNAIDHVDDFQKTTEEIRRVLKPRGKLRLHVHYHKKTLPEPIEINDNIMKEAFLWCTNFKKIHESKSKHGYTLPEDGGIYTVWSNF